MEVVQCCTNYLLSGPDYVSLLQEEKAQTRMWLPLVLKDAK